MGSGPTSVPLDLPTEGENTFINHIHTADGVEHTYVCEHNFCSILPSVNTKDYKETTIQQDEYFTTVRDTLLISNGNVLAFACELNKEAIGYDRACEDYSFADSKYSILVIFKTGLKIAANLPPDMRRLRDCADGKIFLCTPLLCVNKFLANSIEIVETKLLTAPKKEDKQS